MNVIILGGNGYLGSKLAHSLVQSIGYDSVVCTQRENSRYKRLDDLKDKIQIIPTSAEAISNAMEKQDIDTVFNMICSYSRSNCLYDNVFEANIAFPLKILDLSVQKKVRRFINIGTGLPYDLNMYSFSKSILGDFGKYYSKKYDISFTDVSLEMFYGSDEPRERFLPAITEKMLKGETVEVTMGTQHRDIISVNDVVNALNMILNARLEGYSRIPVGTGTAPTVSEVVDFIWDKTGRKSVVYKGAVPMRENEPDCAADTSALRAIGEWKPLQWQKGLSEMIEQMKKD